MEYEKYYKESGTLLRRCKRYFKDNFAWGDTFDKFSSVISMGSFTNLTRADETIDWEKSVKVEL